MPVNLQEHAIPSRRDAEDTPPKKDVETVHRVAGKSHISRAQTDYLFDEESDLDLGSPPSKFLFARPEYPV